MDIYDSVDFITALREVKNNGQILIKSKVSLQQRMALMRDVTLLIKAYDDKEITQLKLFADKANLVFVDCVFRYDIQIRAKSLSFVNCKFFELGKVAQPEYTISIQNDFKRDGFYSLMSRDIVTFEGCLFFECAAKLQSSYDPFKTGQYQYLDQ